MNYLWTVFRVRLCATARAPLFLVTAGFFALLTILTGLILPAGQRGGLAVGLLPTTPIGSETARLLEESGDYQIQLYQPGERAQMERDILRGQLHCGYLLSDEWTDAPPIVLLKTDGSYLHPMLDQAVFAAYYTSKLPRMTEEYLERLGIDQALAGPMLEMQRQSAHPFVATLERAGGDDLNTLADNSMQPLIYAVLVTCFLSAGLLFTLLSGSVRAQAEARLCALSGHPILTRLGIGAAVSFLYLAAMLATDLLVSALSPQLLYPFSARLALMLLTAICAALLCAGARVLVRWSGAVCALLLPAMLLSVFFSGAIVDLALLPPGLAGLRFLSPGWYALELLRVCS